MVETRSASNNMANENNLVNSLRNLVMAENQRPKINPAPLNIKFDGDNLKDWLFELKLWAIESKCDELLDVDQITIGKEEDIKMIRATILRNMNRDIAMLVCDKNLPSEIIEELKARYEQSSSRKMVQLHAEWSAIKMKPDESLQAYISRFDLKLQEAYKAGANIPNEIIIDKFLKSLTSKYDSYKQVLEMSDNLDYLTIKQKLIGIKFDNDNNNNSQIPSNQAFQSNQQNFQRSRRMPRKCYNCGSANHIIRNCPTAILQRQQRQQYGRQNFNNQRRNVNSRRALLSQQDESESIEQHYAFAVPDSNNSNEWYVDSASSNHYSNSDLNFKNKRNHISTVLAANGQQSTCDRGNIVIFNRNECIFVDENCDLYFDETKLKMKVPRKNNAYVFNANKTNFDNYPMSLYNDENNAFAVIPWHRRFGHPGINKLSRMLNTTIRHLDCEECNMTKIVRTSHPERFENFKLMQRVSADIMGPLPDSFAGHKYVLHLVEHSSSFGGVYMIKTKTEAVKYVIDFINYCENQTNKKLKEV
uniref:Retrovirus-related Polpolyprotein from transposon TNT1-94 n=1 Tax=Psoroptes ovis TaxID=83912 RepID=A0A3B0QN27_PSOOV|nr:Retrovirus-related Polpolyprotein from transposon TNT1-94 [Psoroptes ovis]